ncbi:MAG: hypothetical protein AUG91_04395 [Actinobacteria bacterium 13_1_20CM_4_69_9]|nr:MAG: hypothetical protein AUG91_04395 [Actinobacteria bacterium 13_1_20CM_4_69_9]
MGRTSATAPAYDDASTSGPTPSTSTTRTAPWSSAAATPSSAGPMPSASDGQKRAPYRRIDSATSWPTVRVSGGSGGGS